MALPVATKRGEPFFTVFALLLLAVVLIGFGPSFYLRTADRPPLSALLAWHGVTLTLWYVLAIVQGALLGFARSGGRLRLHRRLGMASGALAIAVIWTGAAVAVDFYHNGTGDVILTPAGLLVGNLTNLFGFAVCFTAGVWLRRRPLPHKRLMAMAGVVMIGPAAFRLVVNLGLAPPFALAVQLAFVAALFTYDRLRMQRIHPASWTGLALIAFQVAATLAVG